MASPNPFIPSSITVERELAEVAKRLQQITVEVYAGDHGRGSGVICRADGLIVTNAHVTSSLNAVRLFDGRVFDARLLRRDQRLDLAVLRIGATGLHSAQWRAPDSLHPGELALAVGNPQDATGALALGVVAARPRAGEHFVRADIRLAPGNSGGPLGDAEGRVLGINTVILGGFGMAVTSTAAQTFVAGVS